MTGPRILTILLALMIVAAAPAVASARCLSSSPSTIAFDDAPNDAQSVEEPGDAPDEVYVISAPEITRVVGSIDAACTISFDTELALPPGETEPLVARESLRYYLDIDANPATGGTVTGAEWLVLVNGVNGTDTVQLLRWNGTAFAEPRRIALTGAVGFSLPLGELGITAPGTIGVRVHSRLIYMGQSLVDIAPDREQPQLLFGLAFTVPAPPAPPAPPAVVPPAPPVAAVSTCRVPKVRGLNTAAALKRMKAAGCRTKTVRRPSKTRRGRVATTFPAAGTTTARTITVVVSTGPKAKKRKR